MLAKVTSFALVGLESTPVQVEIDISRGLPSQTIVGLPDAAVRESREWARVSSGHCDRHSSVCPNAGDGSQWT